MIKLNGVPINITHFPDRTTQVWKLELSESINIEWDYESDAEIFHLAQLLDLCVQHVDWKEYAVKLFIPYFPYARQDKDVDNQNTFALNTLMEIFYHYFPCLVITTIDVHSSIPYDIANDAVNWCSYGCPGPVPFKNLYPESLLEVISDYDNIVFPDKGAKDRYSKLFRNGTKHSLSKVRNQQTGEITHMEFSELGVWTGGNVCIVDDICDGGRTFISAARAMVGLKYDKLDLIITHGIFSNTGLLECMVNDCFDKVITTDSLYRNLSWYEACQQDYKYKTINRYINEGKMSIFPCNPGIEYKF